jgi:hypothetical protein
MISIVISSYRPDYYTCIESNIAETIGAEMIYELIQIKNPGVMGLCEAYNKGLDQAQYSYVLFLHEDLCFNKPGWGRVILDIFKGNSKIGLIGVAGGLYKSKAPSGWWHINDTAKYIYVRHGSKTENAPMHYGFGVHTQEQTVRVLSIDGLFIALKKSTGLRFNERLKGYHQYDLGISIDAYLNGHETVSTSLIDITHYSLGNIDKSWIESADTFFKIYARHLPLSVNINLTKTEKAELERKNYMQFISIAWEAGLQKIARKYWLHFLWKESFSKKALHFWRELTR